MSYGATVNFHQVTKKVLITLFSIQYLYVSLKKVSAPTPSFAGKIFSPPFPVFWCEKVFGPQTPVQNKFGLPVHIPSNFAHFLKQGESVDANRIIY